MPMQLTFLGGADEVGASSLLLEMGGKRIVIDAGIRISPKTSRGIQNDQLPDLYPISQSGGPDYILVTHAHTDHTGALPLVVEQYPHVPVIATRPTQVLTGILQRDAQKIMQSRREEEGELPIFDEVASSRLMNNFQTIEFNQPMRLGESLQVTYHVSGHIAGAATLVFEGEEGILVVSGDVSLNKQRAVESMKIPNVKADALVLESTYGGKLHANRDAEEKRMIETLTQVAERGGKILIPAFALGRAQEVLQILLAYRDQLGVAIYVDGMVRSVCNGYATFADLLPNYTVKAAGEQHLFFRKKIKSVDSVIMRNSLLESPEPCIIIASSGMLTGGASVAYAKALAGDERNAIFLTGYQDEESPGRAIQKMIREREQGKEAILKIDKGQISVRCELGTYSLSAHADEMELVSIAEALQVSDIMLVHGDPSARHSLATALRQRGRRVVTPKIGQTESLDYGSRPWALSKVKAGHETRPFEPKALWEALRAQAGNVYSAAELAQMWWGDSTRGGEVIRALDGSVYFTVDWRRKDNFQVNKPDYVASLIRRRQIMLEHPDLIGKLIVMRDVNRRPRVGVVVGATIDSFEAELYQTKGRNYPADALLWVIGQWEGYKGISGFKTAIATLVNDAKTVQDAVLPHHIRQELVADGDPVNPLVLMPDELPEGVTHQQALVAIVLSLAADGAEVQDGGLIPQHALLDGPMNQTAAQDFALNSFPPEARLRRVGVEPGRMRILLNFDFPDRAANLYADIIESVEDQTGWQVVVRPNMNQQALGDAIFELLPSGAAVVKGPSYFINKKEVGVEVTGVKDFKALQDEYRELTGFQLIDLSGGGVSKAIEGPGSFTPTAGPQQMEINAAYAVVRRELEPLGLVKVGLKNGALSLSFISPQIGARYLERIARLAEETGYRITVHPHPNQQMILQIAGALVRDAGWIVRKGPGLHVERATISYGLAEMPSVDDIADLEAQLREKTGYELIVTQA